MIFFGKFYLKNAVGMHDSLASHFNGW